jgi:hypothetical protein
VTTEEYWQWGTDDDIRIPEEDDDDYPCLDEAACGAVCVGECYPYGSEAAYP